MSSVDIGMDLGTANTIITIGKKGIVVNEPSVVAFDKKKKQVIAVGSDAYEMIGKTPEYIVAISPLKNGVISDNLMAEYMVKEFIRKVSGSMLIKPRVILCVPSSVTEVENRAIIEAAIAAGARKVYLIEEPIAALLGAGIDIKKPIGTMIVDVGGGTTDVAVVSFNGIVQSASVKIAGNSFNSALIKHIHHKYKFLIGDRTADDVKRNYANIYTPSDDVKFVIRGRDLVLGMPGKIEITETDIFNALSECVASILAAIRKVLEKTPPELVGDIYTNGVILTGGGALLKGLDILISEELQVKCMVAENPIECVARGVAKAFKYTDDLLDGFKKVSLYRYK